MTQVWSQIIGRRETPPIARGGWLDALRFIVAGLIILHHFQAYGPHPLAEVINPIFERAGFLLTNFFLIDSGYVLMRVYGGAVGNGRMSPGDFVLKRLLRVWPAHLMMGWVLVVTIVFGAAVGVAPSNPEWFAWDQLPAQLLLVQSFGVHGGLGWNAPSWSVSALIGCYLAFPWILRGVTRLNAWNALLLGIGVYLLANQLCWLLLDFPVYQMPMKYGFFRALPLFFLGMCLAWFAQTVWINPRLAGWTGVLAAVALLLVELHDKHSLVALTLISLIILAAGAIPVTKPNRWVEQAAMVSFSMFITNEVTRIIWFAGAEALIARFNLSAPVQWVIWGLGVVAAFAAAFAFHYLIDNPLQDRIRAWFKRKGRQPSRIGPVVSLEG
ncbi:MAG: acyltransferase [Brevundimonas sp.]|nr:MAG: acyltransferase [Brevundimonas sp.]